MYNSIKRCMMKIFDKINFREPKYMLPAVLYIPLLVASYFIFDLFHTETAEIQDAADNGVFEPRFAGCPA